MEPPQVSIVICTGGRLDSLQETLSSVVPAAVAGDLAAEIVVVENQPRPEAKEAVERFDRSHPRLTVRHLHQPRRGKGHAYRSGIAAAAGRALLFTDDDVRVPPDWVRGMAEPLLAGSADALAGGVRIAPHLVRPWMTPIYQLYAASTAGLDAEAPDFMIGANMAFGRHVLAKVPQFDPELGPGALGFYEEVLFSWQLKRAGFVLAGALDVEVEHHFDPGALERRRWLKRIEDMARSRAYVDYHWHHEEVPVDYWRRALRGLRWRLAKARLLRWRELLEAEGSPEWEFNDLRPIAYIRQLLAEAGTPRKYERQGLTKLG